MENKMLYTQATKNKLIKTLRNTHTRKELYLLYLLTKSLKK